ncbi:MAG: DNA polymerase/3'-5' exonuclease PolX [Phycisphaerales bacterium]|nr:DNA polymerase/3'-5' exonuclease PolX [Phycisphaerales bacterium]
MSTNGKVVAAFEELAVLSEILGANGFKVSALRRAARTIEALTSDACTMEASVLQAIDGIGASTVAKIHEFSTTGTMTELLELRAQVPAGLTQLLQIQGLGPKTVRSLWTDLEVVDLATLKAAIDSGAISKLPRMGPKSIENLKEGIEFLEQSRGRIRIGEALPIAEALVRELKTLPSVQRIAYAGSLRRGRETIGDIDVLAASTDAPALMEAFRARLDVAKVLVTGETKTSVLTKHGMQIDLRVVPLDRFGSALLYFTGSTEHNIRLRERAIAQQMRLNEYGLFHAREDGTVAEGASAIVSAEEPEIYAALGLQWVPPTMREDRGELDAFATGAKVPNVVEIKDIRAELHCHTVASDGAMTIDEIITLAQQRGFHTIAITDHSKSQAQAGGLPEPRLLEHIAAIHAARTRFPTMQIWAGSEVDILSDGSLDYTDEILAKLDWVVASPHAALKQESKLATARILAAIRHPLVHVIGHPTGRIVNGRPGLELAMDELFAAAKQHSTALEINAQHLRLDLRDTDVRGAMNAGCMIAINCDVHGDTDFDELRYGVLTAQRGWLPASQCLNALDAKSLNAWRMQKR